MNYNYLLKFCKGEKRHGSQISLSRRQHDTIPLTRAHIGRIVAADQSQIRHHPGLPGLNLKRQKINQYFQKKTQLQLMRQNAEKCSVPIMSEIVRTGDEFIKGNSTPGFTVVAEGQFTRGCLTSSAPVPSMFPCCSSLDMAELGQVSSDRFTQ